MKEKWIKWEPISGLGPRYCIESISDDVAGFKRDPFKVILSDADNRENKVQVAFSNSPHAYRYTKRNVTHELNQKNNVAFYGNWTFFKVENSAYLEWISEQSTPVFDDIKFIHYLLVAVDSIVDIVTPCKLKVAFINKNGGYSDNQKACLQVKTIHLGKEANKKLTIDEAYEVVLDYLKEYYTRTYANGISAVLSGMRLFKDGTPFDFTAGYNWIESVRKIFKQNRNIDQSYDVLNEKLTAIEAYAALIDYLEEYLTWRDFDGMQGLLSAMKCLQDGVSTDFEAWQNWMKSVNKVLNQNYKVQSRLALLKEE